jgi:histidinol-phosphate aminotransferase
MGKSSVAMAGVAAVAGAAAYFYYLSQKSADEGGEGEGAATGVSALVRPNIRSLQPYRCARDDYSEGILLDANENSIGATVPPVPGDSRELNRYPCPYQIPLKELISAYRGVRPENIFLGVGSDEAIDMIMRIFCAPGKDSILITPPTYGMYSVCAKVNDVEVQKVPLSPEFDVVVEDVLAAVRKTTKLIFLCSPGNPTAKSIPLATVERVATAAPNAIVIVDEAYVDFSETKSACCLVDKYPNMIVMQTLSKAFGLAGIRLGMAIGNPEIIHYFNTMKAPYNISKLTSEFAQNAFKHKEVMEKNIKLLLEERTRVDAALRAFPFVKRVCHSDTNFLLFELGNAKTIYSTMADSGVVVRYRGGDTHCKDCLRVTIGSPKENDRFLELLEATAKAQPAAGS